MHLLQEGGPIFMYTLLLLLFISLGLIAYGFIKPEQRKKSISLLSAIGLFSLVFGFLGQVLGLIAAFDAIEAVGDVSTGVLAAGLKISFLTSAFGALVFLVGRFGIIVLTWITKD